MQYLIGFIIALFITLTGVGAGTITVPILVLFLGVPAPVAVSIGLMFSAAVKLILVPAQSPARQYRLAHPGIHAAGRGARGADRLAGSQATCDGRLAERREPACSASSSSLLQAGKSCFRFDPCGNGPR